MKFLVIAIFALLSLLSVNSVDGKVFLNCELAQQLSKSHVEKHLVPHFICLAGAASQMNSAKSTPMPNKSMSYGLFQVRYRGDENSVVECSFLIVLCVNQSLDK